MRECDEQQPYVSDDDLTEAISYIVASFLVTQSMSSLKTSVSENVVSHRFKSRTSTSLRVVSLVLLSKSNLP